MLASASLTSIYTPFAIYFNAIIPTHDTFGELCKHFQENVPIKKRSRSILVTWTDMANIMKQKTNKQTNYTHQNK